jgi:RepB DNA-primase from phage plasmid
MKHGGRMAEAGDTTSHDEAQAMLDIFASVGTDRFDVTRTTAAGDKDWFRRGVSLADLARTLPAMLDAATSEQRNVIVRPHGPGVSFLQLDDLAAARLPALRPAVFLTLETSPGNFQAWLAMPGREDKDFARRVRKSTGADATASGATRVAGSRNFKDKYAPKFPRVTIREARAGHVTSAAELERLGLVAPPEEFAPLPVTPARSALGGNRPWPSYAHALDGAPLDSEGHGPDRSRADFVWCMTAITWGFGVDETAERLLEESTKARANGKSYAVTTARNAALAVERRRQTTTIRRSHG